MAEALEEMRALEGRHDVDPVLGIERLEARPLRIDERPVDELPRSHGEAGVLGSHAPREIADHFVVAAAFAGRLDELAAEHQVRVATALIDVVMLEEHGGGEHDVGEFRRLGHELLVDAGEEILPRQPLLHLRLVGCDRGRIGVLHEQHLDRRAALEVISVAQQHRADAALVKNADAALLDVEALDHRLVDAIHAAVRMEGTAALMLPRARHHRNAGDRMHVGRPVARAREAIADAEVAPLRLADECREGLDVGGRNVADLRGPFRSFRLEVLREVLGRVGEFLEIGPVGMAVAEQHMHHRAGERPVGAGADQHLDVRLPHGAGVVDVDTGDLRPPVLAGHHGVGHHVDLRVDRVAAPDDDEVGLLHLARVDAGDRAGARHVARP